MASKPTRRSLVQTTPPEAYFVVSAIFHYLGPAFAVLLFARVDVLGVAWLRIASAARDLRRCGGARGAASRGAGRLLLAWGVVLAAMNSCFYLAIDRLPLEHRRGDRVPPGNRAGRRSARARRATSARSPSRSRRLPADRRRPGGRSAGRRLRLRQRRALRRLHRGQPPRRPARPVPGIDLLGVAMLIAAVVVTPIGGGRGARLRRPGGDRGRHRRRRLVLGHPLRRRPARDGAHVALDLRAHGRAAAGDRDGHRHRRPRAAAHAVEALGVALVVAGVAVHRDAGTAASRGSASRRRASRRRRRRACRSPTALDLAQDALLAEAQALGDGAAARVLDRGLDDDPIEPQVANPWST